MAETLSLTPASGSGLGKVLFAALLADPGFLPLMTSAAIGGLTACFPKRWDKELEDWGEPEPDYKTRVQTFLALWAQAEGEPVKRTIHQHINAGGNLDELAAIQESPAMLAALERTLAKAKAGMRKPTGTKRAEPVAADLVVE